MTASDALRAFSVDQLAAYIEWCADNDAVPLVCNHLGEMYDSGGGCSCCAGLILPPEHIAEINTAVEAAR